MPEPVLISIAAALASRAVMGLYQLVKERFAEDPAAAAALEAAEGAAEDSSAVRELGMRLAGAEADDPEFAQRLRTEWERAGGDLHGESDGGLTTFPARSGAMSCKRVTSMATSRSNLRLADSRS